MTSPLLRRTPVDEVESGTGGGLERTLRRSRRPCFAYGMRRSVLARRRS